MRENIIIGDLHGCRDEFNNLLDKIKYDSKTHRLILVGDIIDRGPDPVGLLRQIRNMQIESVLANHEDKMLRWRRHEEMKEMTGKPNPMKDPLPERKKEWKAFSKEDLQWISHLPPRIHIKTNWYVVHAGAEPSRHFDLQKQDTMMRIRYVDENGNFAKISSNDKIPKWATYWTEKWSQPYNLIFGHHRHNHPTKYINKNNICIALDTGCVFGGALTAYNVERDEYIQIKANKKYI